MQYLSPPEVLWERLFLAKLGSVQHPEDVHILMSPSDSQVLIKAACKFGLGSVQRYVQSELKGCATRKPEIEHGAQDSAYYTRS